MAKAKKKKAAKKAAKKTVKKAAKKKVSRKKAKKAPKRPGYLKSAEKTLDVLELVAKRDSIGVTELAKAKKIGVSTAHRILTTLKKRGFVAQEKTTRRYHLGPKLAKLNK